MRKRSTRKSSASDLLVTPTLVATPNGSLSESPKIFKFTSTCFNTPTSSSSSLKEDSRSHNNHNSKKSAPEPPTASPAPALSSLSSVRNMIADLKEMTSSRIDSIKRQIDCSYSDILKDTEFSHSQLHKRHKVQNQACEQTMHEAEKQGDDRAH